MNKAKYFVVHNKVENCFELEVLNPGWSESNPKFEKLNKVFLTYKQADNYGKKWVNDLALH